jgi:hypothetical protein
MGTSSSVEYEVRAGGASVASGPAADASITLGRDTLAKMAAGGIPVKVSLRRRGERFVTEVYVLYENGEARITGIRHN